MNTTRKLLACGIAAGPLYVIVGIAQILARDGFDMRRHALSLLSNGDWGWVQVANFILTGILVILGAIGVRRLLHPGRAGTWGPILLGAYGVGLVLSGIFVADPALGFPPDTAMPETLSRAGLLHMTFGALSFYAVIAACLVFARYFAGLQRTGWLLYSLITGAGFFFAFGALASGFASPVIVLTFYGAVAWVWIWHTALMVSLHGTARFHGRNS